MSRTRTRELPRHRSTTGRSVRELAALDTSVMRERPRPRRLIGGARRRVRVQGHGARVAGKATRRRCARTVRRCDSVSRCARRSSSTRAWVKAGRPARRCPTERSRRCTGGFSTPTASRWPVNRSWSSITSTAVPYTPGPSGRPSPTPRAVHRARTGGTDALDRCHVRRHQQLSAGRRRGGEVRRQGGGELRVSSSASRGHAGDLKGRVKHHGAGSRPAGSSSRSSTTQDRPQRTLKQPFRSEPDGSYRLTYRFSKALTSDALFRFRVKVRSEELAVQGLDVEMEEGDRSGPLGRNATPAPAIVEPLGPETCRHEVPSHSTVVATWRCSPPWAAARTR